MTAEKASRREALHRLATRRYAARRTADGREYLAGQDGRKYMLAPKQRIAIRGDLCNAWRQDPECVGEPPSDALMNAEIAAMAEQARLAPLDEPTAAEHTDNFLAQNMPVVLEAFDEHPERLTVAASGRNPYDVAREIADDILKNNDPPTLFGMGPAAVLLKEDGTLKALDDSDGGGWLTYVAARVNFVVYGKDLVSRLVAPPAAVMKILPAIVTPELPPLDGLVTSPYLDHDGNVVATDGYHPGTRLVLQTGTLDLPPVSAEPSDRELQAAKDLLMTEWLGDFCWAGPADAANAVAGLLTVVGRVFFPLAPLFVIDASTPGSGKGMLVTTLIRIVTGDAPAFMELPTDGDEQRKKITAAMLEGQTVIAWDESHVIAGRSLAMTLTAETYSDRVLGGNKLMRVRNRATQFSLGNNVQVWGDMKRRVVPSRLTPDTEQPEKKSGWRHPHLEEWVRRNRAQLLGAALTIWRAWDAQGRPVADISFGSFERWARCVGGALAVAGIPGFLGNSADWLDTADDDVHEWAAHLALLRAAYGRSAFTAHDVVARAIEIPSFKRDPDMPLAKALGYQYRKIRDRWISGRRLVNAGVTNGRTRWTVAEREDDAP